MRQRHCIQCLFSFNVKPVGSEARADWWTVHAAFDSRARSNPGSACKGTTAATMCSWPVEESNVTKFRL